MLMWNTHMKLETDLKSKLVKAIHSWKNQTPGKQKKSFHLYKKEMN